MRTIITLIAATLLGGIALAVQPQGETAGTAQAGTAPGETQKDSTVYIEMKTSKGEIYLALDNEKAPISTENFVQYANDKAYDGTIFHRVIEGFMIQGGGFEPDMSKRETRAGIKNEWKNGLKNEKYTIAMARLGGQADSGTNQFFINVKDNFFLDSPRDGAGYAVFGKVVKGMEAVEAIEGVATTTRNGMGDVPSEPVVIETVRVMTADEAKDAGLG